MTMQMAVPLVAVLAAGGAASPGIAVPSWCRELRERSSRQCVTTNRDLGSGRFVADEASLFPEPDGGCSVNARIGPAFRDGKAFGFKLFAIRPGSVYARQGLANGDIVRAVNRIEMTSPDRVLEAYEIARKSRYLELGIERGTTSLVLAYCIVAPGGA